MQQFGRVLMIMGGLVVVIGLLMTLGPRLPFKIGRLPLDFHIQRDNFSFYFPLGTSILVSIVLTLVFGLLTSVQAKGLVTGAPTPWIGLTERACIGASLLWVAALAVALLRSERTATTRSRGVPERVTRATTASAPA